MKQTFSRIVQLLIVVCCSSAFCQGDGGMCRPVEYPDFEDRSSDFFRFYLSGPGQVVVGDYHFGCNGLVTEFEFYCRPGYNDSMTFEFQIWRKDLTAENIAYNLVGKNVLPNASPDADSILSYSVPEGQQIQVQPGDVVGVRAYNAVGSKPFQLQSRLASLRADIRIFDVEESVSTPDTLEDGTLLLIRRLPIMQITTVPVPVTCGLESDQCTRVDYPEFMDLSLNPIQAEVGGPGQILVRSYQFSCNGFVTQFELYTVGSGAQTAEFQVWRKNRVAGGDTTYSLVGTHILPNAKPGANNILSYSVPLDQQIEVHPGDIVGLRAYNATEEDPFQLQAHLELSADVISYDLSENEDTPSLLSGPHALSVGLLPVLRVTTTSATCRGCIDEDYPPFVDRSGDLFRFYLSGPGQLLVGEYEFGCHGHVTKLEFYCRPNFNGAQTFEFHVWRPDTSIADAYHLVGKNTIPNASPGADNILSYSVPEGQQIQVQPGDVVGVRAYNAVEPNPFSIQAHYLGFGTDVDVTAYVLEESEVTPSFLDLNQVGTLLLIPKRVPVMKITVE